MTILPKMIVSGGQTGVDRAALDAAVEAGIMVGGWCPKGRLAEDGRIPDRYPLRETDSTVYAERTRRNVLDSDATLVLSPGRPTGGTALTIDLARRNRKPYLVADPREATEIERVCSWLTEIRIEVLNVAGPRESTSPGIESLARAWLRRVLSR